MKILSHEYAALDVDVISMGVLTHSVRNLSVNLEIIPKLYQLFFSSSCIQFILVSFLTGYLYY